MALIKPAPTTIIDHSNSYIGHCRKLLQSKTQENTLHIENNLTDEAYRKQCDEDIYSIVILHSLEYSELEKLDGPLFPIDFEVWSETSIAENHISCKNYSTKITYEMANDIGKYVKKLISFPSEKWTHSDFESNLFWKESRKTAKELVIKLNIQNRNYWD